MTRETTSPITVPIPRQSMAQLVGMEPADPPEPCDITYACMEPHAFTRCAKCDGHGYLTATVTPRFVTIDGLAYERGQIDGTSIEDLETISGALERVDEECRPRLEWLLYHGPNDEMHAPAIDAAPSPQMRQMIDVIGDEPPVHPASGSITEALCGMLAMAIRCAGVGPTTGGGIISVRDQHRALAQLDGRPW